MNFCSGCGGTVSLQMVQGDDRPRYVCRDCATIHYENPRMVVGAIPVIEGKILLCRRAIEPGRGRWTIPAGWLENGETVSACAMREAEEEAEARLDELQPYALVDLPFINQVYFIFRARLVGRDFGAGPESLEVALFAPEQIPWGNLAFPSVWKTLQLYCHDAEQGAFPFHIIELGERDRLAYLEREKENG